MAQFDFDGARAAGYSNDEILRYLASPGIQPIPEGESRAARLKQMAEAAAARNAPRPAMGPPEAPSSYRAAETPPWQAAGAPGDRAGSVQEAVGRSQLLPNWAENARGAIERDIAASPGLVTGADLPTLPQSKGEAALLAAGALIPPEKLLAGGRGLLRAGTTALEGAAPEVGAMGRALTAENVLAEAANEKKLGFGAWRAQNPEAGEGMFDLAAAQPAMPERAGELPRYDPPRGVSERVADAIGSRKVINALTKMVESGEKGASWYHTSPLYEEYVNQLGPEEGKLRFERLMQNVAATSPRNKVPDNIRTASWYQMLDQQGQPLPAKPAEGYGSIAQKNHMANVAKIRAAGQLDPIQNPKPASFVENLLGNERPVTIDTHNFRALGIASKDPRFLATSVDVDKLLPDGSTVTETLKPRAMYERGELTLKDALKNPTYWESAPNANEYKAFEAVQQKLAAKQGMSPAEWQARMWVGGGKQTGLASPPEPFLKTFAARVQYTAHRMGADPVDVLKAFIGGKIPLLEIGAGAVGLGAAASATNDERAPAQRSPVY
jgi:hypothetical protein